MVSPTETIFHHRSPGFPYQPVGELSRWRRLKTRLDRWLRISSSRREFTAPFNSHVQRYTRRLPSRRSEHGNWLDVYQPSFTPSSSKANREADRWLFDPRTCLPLSRCIFALSFFFFFLSFARMITLRDMGGKGVFLNLESVICSVWNRWSIDFLFLLLLSEWLYLNFKSWKWRVGKNFSSILLLLFFFSIYETDKEFLNFKKSLLLQRMWKICRRFLFFYCW